MTLSGKAQTELHRTPLLASQPRQFKHCPTTRLLQKGFIPTSIRHRASCHRPDTTVNLLQRAQPTALTTLLPWYHTIRWRRLAFSPIMQSLQAHFHRHPTVPQGRSPILIQRRHRETQAMRDGLMARLPLAKSDLAQARVAKPSQKNRRPPRLRKRALHRAGLPREVSKLPTLERTALLRMTNEYQQTRPPRCVVLSTLCCAILVCVFL